MENRSAVVLLKGVEDGKHSDPYKQVLENVSVVLVWHLSHRQAFEQAGLRTEFVHVLDYHFPNASVLNAKLEEANKFSGVSSSFRSYFIRAGVVLTSPRASRALLDVVGTLTVRSRSVEH